jgi:hypothetical protein
MQAKCLEITLLTIFAVTSPHVDVDVLLPRMIAGVSIRQFCEERTRVFGQRMKFDLVYDVQKKLYVKLLAISEKNL